MLVFCSSEVLEESKITGEANVALEETVVLAVVVAVGLVISWEDGEALSFQGVVRPESDGAKAWE